MIDRSTDRKKLENDEMYRLLFKNMMNGFALHKIVLNEKSEPIDYVFLEANDAFEKLTGLKIENILGKKVTEVLPGIEKDSANWIERYGKVALTGKEIRFEQHSQTLGKWFSVMVFSPQKEQFATIFEDITIRKQAEQIIQQKNEFLNLILNSLKHPFYVINASDYTLEIANLAACSDQLSQELTCHAISHRSNTPCNSVEHPCPIDLIKKTKKPVILEHIHHDKDGNPRYVEVHAHPVFDGEGNVSQVIEYTIDVTERKRAEMALLAAEKKYRIVLNANPDPVVVYDKEGNVQYLNPAFTSVFGWSLEERTGKKIDDFVPEENWEETRVMIDKVSAGEKFSAIRSYRFKKDGSKIPVSISGSYYTDQEGNLSATIFNLRDISKHKQTEEALRESQSRYHSLAQTASDAIISINSSGNIVFWNNAAETIFGYTPEEVIGGHLAFIMPDRFRKLHQEGLRRLISGGDSHIIGKTVEVVGLRKDGHEIPIEISMAAMQTKEGMLITGILRDVTERKKTEEEREKMVVQLQNSLAKIKTLGELLPICSYCKKIRDDKGYWSQIESYIHKHSGAEFSHGICPECAKKYYPDMDLYSDEQTKE